MKYAIVKSYGKKGEDVIKKNYAAVDRGGEYKIVDVPAEWAYLSDEDELINFNVPAFVKNIVIPINAQAGDDIPVSAFKGREDGTWIQGPPNMKTRCSCQCSRLEQRQLYPVQSMRLCLSSRCYPSVPVGCCRSC